MLGIRPKKLEYKIITYYYNVHTTILLVQTGGGGRGEERGGLTPEAPDCEGFPLAPSRLAARLASRESEKSSRLAVARADGCGCRTLRLRLRLRFAVPVTGCVLRCVSRKERERQRAWRFPEIQYTTCTRSSYYLTLPPARPSGRILTAGQCPPMSSWLGPYPRTVHWQFLRFLRFCIYS